MSKRLHSLLSLSLICSLQNTYGMNNPNSHQVFQACVFGPAIPFLLTSDDQEKRGLRETITRLTNQLLELQKQFGLLNAELAFTRGLREAAFDDAKNHATRIILMQRTLEKYEYDLKEKDNLIQELTIKLSLEESYTNNLSAQVTSLLPSIRQMGTQTETCVPDSDDNDTLVASLMDQLLAHTPTDSSGIDQDFDALCNKIIEE